MRSLLVVRRVPSGEVRDSLNATLQSFAEAAEVINAVDTLSRGAAARRPHLSDESQCPRYRRRGILGLRARGLAEGLETDLQNPLETLCPGRVDPRFRHQGR